MNRVQLRIAVADVANADTDDSVAVWLADTHFGFNRTGLNYGRDNFARNSEVTYDLNLNDVTRLRDITELTIKKYGNDALCLRSLSLLVNGTAVFSRNFGNSSTTCKWLNNDNGLFNELRFSHADLRSSAAFVGFVGAFPSLVIPKAEMVSRLEGIIGSLIWNNDKVKWGRINNNAAVEIFPVPNQPARMRVDLDLEGRANWLPNPEIDIDFDLHIHFVPENGSFALALDTENLTVNVDFSWWVEVVGALGAPVCATVAGRDCVSRIESHIKNQVEKAFKPVSQRVALGQLPCVPKATVDANADIILGCQ